MWVTSDVTTDNSAASTKTLQSLKIRYKSSLNEGKGSSSFPELSKPQKGFLPGAKTYFKSIFFSSWILPPRCSSMFFKKTLLLDLICLQISSRILQDLLLFSRIFLSENASLKFKYLASVSPFPAVAVSFGFISYFPALGTKRMLLFKLWKALPANYLFCLKNPVARLDYLRLVIDWPLFWATVHCIPWFNIWWIVHIQINIRFGQVRRCRSFAFHVF